MGKFNKKEYDKQFIKDNYDQIRLSVRKESKVEFAAYCTKIGVKPTPYITKLINDDAIRRGYPPIFGVSAGDNSTNKTDTMPYNNNVHNDNNID